MAVLCPRCGAQYDATLFEYGTKIKCDCGLVFGLEDSGRTVLPEKGESGSGENMRGGGSVPDPDYSS